MTMDLSNCIATIQYSLDGFSFLIYDDADDKILSLKHHDINEGNNTFRNTLKIIQETCELNIGDFSKVNVLVDNEACTLVPASIFRNDAKSVYLKYLGLDND